MNLIDYQMRLNIVVTTLFLSFVLISCNDDKIDNLSVGACTIEGKVLDEKGKPTKKDITVSCTENVTKNICQLLEVSAIVAYKSEARKRATKDKDIRKKYLPKSKFKANRNCRRKRALASCKTGNVVTYAYNSKSREGLKESCTPQEGTFSDLSRQYQN